MAEQALTLENQLLAKGEERSQRQSEAKKIEGTTQDLLDVGVEIQIEELVSLKAEAPEHPSFPIIIFGLAVLKDTLDLFSLGILGILTNIIIVPIIWLWLFRKLGFVKRALWRRFILFIFIEFIPFVSFVPVWTIFIVRAHLKEYDQINNILEALEKRFS